MKTLYLDLISGIAGDMFIGALLDLGIDPGKFDRELQKLDLDGYHLHISRGERSAISGVKFDVHLAHDHEASHDEHQHAHDHHHEHGHGHQHEHDHDHHHEHEHAHQHAHEHGHAHSHEHEHSPEEGDHHEHSDAGSRDFAGIRKLISGSKLSKWVKAKSIAVFARIAEAEGKIHGVPAEEVHFHEVGAVDSIVDIVGAAVALELLGKPRVLASVVTEGTGWIRCAHGRFPIPAPATLAILGARGIALSQCDEPHELVTPTGAALLAEFAEDFGPMENLVAKKIGFGLGTRDTPTRPNVLRAILGTQSKKPGGKKAAAAKSELGWETDRIAVLETNLDDCPGEILGGFMGTALKAGALDVFHTAIQMKKGRPGVLLTVLCDEDDADKFAELILRHTTSFGVRKTLAERRKLPREFTDVKTPFGDVTVKIGRLGGKVVQVAAEFESAKKAAAAADVPVKSVFDALARSIKR